MLHSHSGITKPNPKYALSSQSIYPLPTSPKCALLDHNWNCAIKTEFNALLHQNTWDLVPRPHNVNVIGCHWIYRHKFKSDGSLKRYKARLVVNGKSQEVGVDCGETFNSVLKPTTIRTVLSLALSRNWSINQLDVKNAFLHGTLKETVYMHQPPSFVDLSYPGHVCKLCKSLYGLKQGSRAWYQRFAHYLLSIGFMCSKSDNSLFILHRNNQYAYLLVYVDDIILIASSLTLKAAIISSLKSEFDMNDLGKLTYF